VAPGRGARSFIVEAADAGSRVDAFLAARLGVGRAAARALLEAGAVRIDERRLGRRHKGVCVTTGSCVAVEAFLEPGAQRARPEPELPLEVLASGSDPSGSGGPGPIGSSGLRWLAVDKPAGRPVHPLRENEGGTLLNALIARHPELHGVGEGGLRSGVVHRLDVDTSGIVLFATEAATWTRLREAFRAHRVEKVYRALVVGRMSGEGALAVGLAVVRHRPARVAVVEPGRPGARLAETRWRALAHGPGVTLLELRPRTGFLHQIRVTLAHLGHPVCGDALYGAPGDPSGAPRQLLHAARLAVDEVEAASPDPPDFAAACARLLDST
jgi:23S rRNA pseudouridine1911/1915/1917 synthase